MIKSDHVAMVAQMLCNAPVVNPIVVIVIFLCIILWSSYSLKHLQKVAQRPTQINSKRSKKSKLFIQQPTPPSITKDNAGQFV